MATLGEFCFPSSSWLPGWCQSTIAVVTPSRHLPGCGGGGCSTPCRDPIGGARHPAAAPVRPSGRRRLHGHMLAQPRLRFLLGRRARHRQDDHDRHVHRRGHRRGLIPGQTVIIVPAHLVEKWRRDLRRLFGIDADRSPPSSPATPADLDPRVDVWVVSVDLFTHNPDVRRKVAGARASWSLAVFDEAHRLTPTSPVPGRGPSSWPARTHHLLLLTATPHRGKEHFFRGLLNLLDPDALPVGPRGRPTTRTCAAPQHAVFLRRMKEDLIRPRRQRRSSRPGSPRPSPST